MSCSEYDFFERALWKAKEEIDHLRVHTLSLRTASNVDALVGAELTKAIINAARLQHIRDCSICVREKWNPQLEVRRERSVRY